MTALTGLEADPIDEAFAMNERSVPESDPHRWGRILDRVAHRPWPLPSRPWAMTMCWRDLLFMHWPLARERIAHLVPPGLEIDTFEGAAWIGVVPFRMTDIGLRLMTPLPVGSAFAELNVRTYVKRGDESGVWFLSLDAASRLAVEVARAHFHLPYFHAAIRCHEEDGWFRYENVRRDRRGARAIYRGRYRPIPGSLYAGELDRFLTERYCFFARSRAGILYRTDVHHAPWPLERAEAVVDANTMAEAAGVPLPEAPPMLHFASKLDVIAWTPERT
jgi:uncharacterized protein YqjF (DUF2071 family)